MGNARLIPERTVDSLLAAEVVRHDPFSLIWSPTQSKGSVDHVVRYSSNKLAIFECKAVDSVSKGRRWTAPLDLVQLRRYLNREIPALYVFLVRPLVLRRPDECNCSIGPCESVARCVACCTDTRAYSGLNRSVMSAPAEMRLQPWFCHWAWIIPARDLQDLLPSGARSQSTTTVKLDDRWFHEHRTYGYEMTRLCHFLRDVVSGHHAGTAGRVPWATSGDVSEVLGLLREVHWSLDDGDRTLPVVVGFSNGGNGRGPVSLSDRITPTS